MLNEEVQRLVSLDSRARDIGGVVIVNAIDLRIPKESSYYSYSQGRKVNIRKKVICDGTSRPPYIGRDLVSGSAAKQ